MNEIKWLWNGLKVNGKFYAAHYSKCVLIRDTEESITVYARSYSDGLPRISAIENNSDMMTDYSEKDRMRVRQNSPFWEDALTAWEKQEAHYAKMAEKRKQAWAVIVCPTN